MDAAVDISELIAQYENPEPDISKYVDLKHLALHMKGIYRKSLDNLTQSEQDATVDPFSDEDISAISNGYIAYQEQQEHISRMAKDRLQLLIRSYAGTDKTEMESRYEMITEKLRQYLPPVPQQSLDTLQKITADLSNIAEKANKREKFLAKIR
jgi:hypothetical protein